MLMKTVLGTLVTGLLLAGCGSNDKAATDAGPAGAAGTAAGTTGVTAGTTAGGTATADGGMMQLMCDESVTSVAKCGTESCTAPTGPAATMCQVACCTSDNKCGQKNTSSQAAGAGFGSCMLPAVADPRCDGVSQFGTACCTAAGTCGSSFMGSACFDTSMLGGGGTPVNCDEAGQDAGSN